MTLKEGIKNCLIEKGIINQDWRIAIVEKTIQGKSDYARVKVEVYPPRKRKPHAAWDLCINIVRNQIHWDYSSFTKLRG